MTETELYAQLESIRRAWLEGRVSVEGSLARTFMLGVAWNSQRSGPDVARDVPIEIEARAASPKRGR